MPDVINTDAVEKPHRMGPLNWATFAMFCAIIFIMPVLMIAGVSGKAKVDNRALAEPPEFYWDEFATIPYFAQWGFWGRDTLPFRGEVIQSKAKGDYDLFGQITGPVVRGKNGYYFVAARFFQPCVEEKARLDGLEQALTVEATVKHMNRLGYDTYFMAPPFKASIYPEYLPSYGEDLVACNLVAQTELRNHLNQAIGDNFIDVLPPMLALKETASEPLFMPLQTHWDSYLGLKQAEEIVNRLQPGLWDDGLVIDGEEIDRVAEVPALAGMQMTERVNDYHVSRTGVDVDFEWKKDIKQSATGYRVAKATPDRPGRVIPGKTIIVHDSFMLESAQALSNYFEELWLIRFQDARQVAPLAAQLEDADRIIFEAVEDRTRGRIYGELSARYLPPSLSAKVERELRDAVTLPDEYQEYPVFNDAQMVAFDAAYEQTLQTLGNTSPAAPLARAFDINYRQVSGLEASWAEDQRAENILQERDFRRAKVYSGTSLMDDALGGGADDDGPMTRFQKQISKAFENRDMDKVVELLAVPDLGSMNLEYLEQRVLLRDRIADLVALRKKTITELNEYRQATDDESIAKREMLQADVGLYTEAIRAYRELQSELRANR